MISFEGAGRSHQPGSFNSDQKFDSKGHFTLGVWTKETQELSNPIGGELKIGLNGFTLGVKVCQNDYASTWHHFGAKFSWS
jgi:hypothetical protein